MKKVNLVIAIILFNLSLVSAELQTSEQPKTGPIVEGEAGKNASNDPNKVLPAQDANSSILDEPEGLEKEKTSCNLELIHAYKMFPFNNETENYLNYLCPYVFNDCCSFNSQKMIQVLWIRISQPRLQRVLTKHLFHIESIINHLKEVLHLFEVNELPEHEKYSAECLESLSDMRQYIDKNLQEKLDFFYENIKKGFNVLYKFKKQFYCQICNQDNHDFYNLFDKQIYYSKEFCAALSADFKDISWFLNYELVKYYETIRNYILCYKEKNYLLTADLYKFKENTDELSKIAKCRIKNECEEFCNNYSTTDLPEFFIGKENKLERTGKMVSENFDLDQRETLLAMYIRVLEADGVVSTAEMKDIGNMLDIMSLPRESIDRAKKKIKANQV